MAHQTNSKPQANIVRCVTYARVSTDEQLRGDYTSIDNQQFVARSQIQTRSLEGWQLVREITDPGRSGSTLERPGIRELKELIRSGQVDQLVVLRIDRLTRSIRDFYELWDLMEKHHVELCSCNENIDTTTPLGKVILNIILTFAQFEREMTSERLREKFSGEARQGMKHPGMASYGYSNAPGRTLAIKPDEAKVVKQIYDLLIELKKPASVAKAINAKGYRTSVRTRKNGKNVGGVKWTAEKIRRLVCNPSYKGVRMDAHGHEFKALWEPIVSEQIWQKAQNALAEREIVVHPSRPNKHEMLLKGKLTCGCCNQAMSPKPGGKLDKEGNPRNYYVCQNVINHGKDSDCAIRNLPGNAIDAFIIEIIGEFAKHPDIIGTTLNQSGKEARRSTRPLKSRLKELGQEQKKLDAELKAFTDMAKKGGTAISKVLMAEAEKLAQRKEELDREQATIEIQIKQREGHLMDETMVAEALTNFVAVFDRLSFEDKTRLIDRLIENIRVTPTDPEKDNIPGDPAAFAVKIRTSWYRIDINFRITSLFRDVCKKAGKSSYFASIGGEGGIRTPGTLRYN